MAEKRAEFPIEQQLRQDITKAQKARDQIRLDTLRMALGAIHNEEVARTDRKNENYGKQLTEKDALHVVEQEVKKRKQAIPLYKKAGRNELVDKEQHEMDILQVYLQSSQMSENEIRAIVSRLIEQHGNEFKKIMPFTIKETKGKADGSKVQQIVREMTQ